MTPDYGVRFQKRERTGLDVTSDSSIATDEQKAMSDPNWVKIERIGSEFNGYYSTDGVNWTAMAWNPQTVTMVSANVYIGLALTSHSSGNAALAEFSGVQTSGAVSGSWEVAEIGDAPHPANDTADFYVTLEDSLGRTATQSYSGGTNVTEWTEWPIPLADFAGVDAAAIKKMYIGVGNAGAPAADGAGMMLIDEIHVITSEPIDPNEIGG
jgi:hypothetical protein